MEEPADRVRVTSSDGTPIAASRSGEGPPVVLVHGTGGSDFSWSGVVPLLAQRTTVYAMQRRGRGDSGDAGGYSLQREAEDVAALVDSIGGGVAVVGHGYGANCALEASLLRTNISRLALYEPAMEWPNPGDYVDLLESLAAEGRNEDVLLEMFAVAGLNPDDIDELRSDPTWEERMALAPTVPREERIAEGYRADPERFRELRVPTLILTGELSVYRPSMELLREALPGSRIAVLKGQTHTALTSGAQVFADIVLPFLFGEEPKEETGRRRHGGR